MVLGRPSVKVCVLLVAVDHENRACILLVQPQNVVVLQYSPINNVPKVCKVLWYGYLMVDALSSLNSRTCSSVQASFRKLRQ